MGRNSITVDEYYWALEVCKHCRLVFDEHEDDPTPEEIADHYRERSAELKAQVYACNAQIKVIDTPSQNEYFEALQRNCFDALYQVEAAINTDQLSKANNYLKEAEELVKTFEEFIHQTGFHTLNTRDLRDYKRRIQSYYKTVSDTPDKSTKRDFEKLYVPVINLIAETEDLVESKGTAAEETVKSNMASIDAQVNELSRSFIPAVIGAERAKYDARFNPAASKKQSDTPEPEASPPQSSKEFWSGHHQSTMNRIHALLDQEHLIQAEELRTKFRSHKELALQMDGVITRLLQKNSLDSVKAELAQLEKMIPKLQACIDQAHPDNLKRDGQKASAYRKTLRSAQKKAKQLAVQQTKIPDPDVSVQYAEGVLQINEKISKIGWILASGEADRLQKAEQGLRQLEALMVQTQTLYADAIARQQEEERLRKQGNECRTKSNSIRLEVKEHLKGLDRIVDFRKRAALEAQLQGLNALTSEITATLLTQGPNRVARAEAVLDILRAEYEQLKVDYLAALQAEKQRRKERRKKAIKYKHEADGVRNNVDSRATPSGRNPEFYCEKQKGNLCVKHAINACLGFGAITEEDITNGVYAGTIDSYEHQTDEQLYREVESYFPDLTLADMKKELAKDRQGFYRKAAEKHFNWLFNGVSPEAYVEQNGADTEIGIAALRAKQKALGLPEPVDTYLEPLDEPGGLQKSLDKVREITADETKDRLVLAYGDHLVALRKNTEGDWFEIDSFEDAAKRVDLEKYIEEKARVDPRDGLVLLHFDGDLNPPPPQPAQPIRRPRR